MINFAVQIVIMSSAKYFIPLALAFAASLTVPASAVSVDNNEKEGDELAFISSGDYIMPTLEELLGEKIDDFDDFETLRDEMVSYSQNFIGTRYRLGASGPKAFDCSGFTSYVFRQFGLTLRRDSRSQGTQGTQISVEEAQPGDLIFFSGRRAGKSIGHVGIVIESNPENGSVKFIHASTSRGVQIDSYPGTAYYAKRFISVRRVLGEEL